LCASAEKKKKNSGKKRSSLSAQKRLILFKDYFIYIYKYIFIHPVEINLDHISFLLFSLQTIKIPQIEGLKSVATVQFRVGMERWNCLQNSISVSRGERQTSVWPFYIPNG
jgi:hypothetical protein